MHAEEASVMTRRPTTPAVLLAVFAVTAATAAQSGTIGAGVTDRPATPIADLYAAPEKFIGTAIRIEGVVTAVCQEMGCWMALAPAGEPERAVRVKVDHGNGLVFPISAKGRTASAEGVFERIADTDAEGREAAAEHSPAGPASTFGSRYHVKATGAILR
jgi:hypothetical protein